MKAYGPKLFKDLKTSGEISKADFKFVPKDPSPGFSVEHNRRVIEQSIKKNEALMRAKRKIFEEGLEERTDAGTHFLMALARGKFNSSDPKTAAMKYFGRRELARLRGEEIKEEMMRKMRQTAKDIGLA